MPTLLHLDSSGRQTGSLTRRHSAALAQSLAKQHGYEIIYRDLMTQGIPFVDEAMIGGYFTAKEERTAEQNAAIQASDAMVAELAAADVVVIGLPIYNFHAPAVFKAWADQVARMNVSFTFGEQGAVGLLRDRPVHVVLAYGGTTIGSEMDFVTPWLKAFLGFLGIKDIRLISAIDS
jgi:FMN-dependent NADH-azoreductase